MTNRSRRTAFPLAAVALLTCSLAAAPGALGQHDHEHGAHGTAGLALNDGARWNTDAPLRAGMQRIRDAAVSALDAWPKPLPQAEAKALATAIRDQVSYLVTNCKLEPKADAVLHVLLADLLGGAEALERDPQSQDGLPRIGRALRLYPEYFDHPGWQPVPDRQ